MFEFSCDPQKAIDYINEKFDGGRIMVAIEPVKQNAKLSYSHSMNSDAVEFVKKYAGRWNLYHHIGMGDGQPRKLANHEIMSLDRIWVDIDNNTNVDELIEAINKANIAHVSEITFSGGGLWLWWLFYEPLVFDSFMTRTTPSGIMGPITAILKSFGADKCTDPSRLTRMMYVPNMNRGGIVAGPLNEWTHRYNPTKDFEDIRRMVAPKRVRRKFDLSDLSPAPDFTFDDFITRFSVPIDVAEAMEREHKGRRSDAMVSVAMQLIRANVPDEWIMAAFLDESLGISAHATKVDMKDPRRAANRAIERAHEYLANSDIVVRNRWKDAARLFHANTPNMFHLNGQTFRHDGIRYGVLEKDELTDHVGLFLDACLTLSGREFQTCIKSVREVHAAVTRTIPRKHGLVPSCDLEGNAVSGLNVFPNGIHDTKDNSFHPHTDALFTVAVMPFDYDPAATECPHTEKAIETWFGDSAGQLRFWQMLGHIYSGDDDLPNIYAFKEPGGTGKSFISRHLIEGMLPRGAHVTSKPKAVNNDKYETAKYEFARVVGFPELIGPIDKESWAEIKKLSGGDMLEVRKMHTNPYSTRSIAIVILWGNQDFHVIDEEKAISRRVKFMAMRPRLFFGKGGIAPDPNLASKIFAERAAIYNRAIKHYRAMRAAGDDLATNESCDDRVRALVANQTSATRFVREFFNVGGDPQHLTRQYFDNDLFDVYRSWCSGEGIDNPMNKTMFRKSLNDIYGVECRRFRVPGTKTDESAKYWAARGLRVMATSIAFDHLPSDVATTFNNLKTVADKKPDWHQFRMNLVATANDQPKDTQ